MNSDHAELSELRLMNRTHSLTIAAGMLLAFGSAFMGAAATGIKCWTNKDGVRECGNAVPPEYAQQEHEEKSAGGLTVKKQERAMTPEEVAAVRVKAEEEARVQAAADAVARKQAASDKVLLYTFSSEDDLELARDGQIANLDSQAKLTESHIAKLEKSLDQLISEAADLERRGKSIPDHLNREIDSMRGQIEDNRTFIANKRLEQEAIRNKFAADIKRFRELRGND